MFNINNIDDAVSSDSSVKEITDIVDKNINKPLNNNSSSSTSRFPSTFKLALSKPITTALMASGFNACKDENASSSTV